MNRNIPLGVAMGVLVLVGGVLTALMVLMSLQESGISAQPVKPIPAETSRPEVINHENFADWKIYRNKKHGYVFWYPAKLELLENYGGKNITQRILLEHSVPFENTGDCDMAEPQLLVKTLNDLTISFEILNEKVQLDYNDGDYRAGILHGKYVYEGIEGCGPDVYYFPIQNNKTLIVRRWIPQLLSGNVNPESAQKLQSVPGVILRQESEQLFYQILSTFEFVDESE